MLAGKNQTALEPFEDRVDILFGELELAILWDRPSILLAVYRSEFVRADAEAALASKLREIGQRVANYRVTSEENADIPRRLSERDDIKDTVFFVSGLQWGGGRDDALAYRALNIRREYFVDYSIRAVFWLTEKEAAALPRQAPDFWAFRHRAMEFVDAAEIGRIIPRARELTWEGLDSSWRVDTDAKIALREGLLSDLPEAEETVAVRAELLYALGGLYRVKRNFSRSADYFRSALDAAKKAQNIRLASWCHNALGTVYWQQTRYNEASVEYRRASELDPMYAYPHNGLGNVYRDQGRYDDAIAEFCRAIELDPQFAYPHRGLGYVYRDQGRYEDAITEFRLATELDPRYAYPHHGLGSVYWRQGRYDQALAEYRRAIELDPQFAYPRSGLASIYRRQGQYDDAIAEYQQAIALEPEEAFLHNGLGVIYQDLGRHADAIAEYHRAIGINPRYVTPHYNLGTIYQDLQRYTDAIEEYQRSINLYPPSNLDNVYGMSGSFQEPLLAYRRAMELVPKKGNVHLSLAVCFRKTGRMKEYQEEIQVARNSIPEDETYSLAALEAVAGNAEEALPLLRAAIEKEPGRRAWARRDPNLDGIRDDPRFKELVGE